MKLTWGHKLIFVFILFGSMMSYMVYRSFATTIDMVSDQYYDDELEYQQLIDGAQRNAEERSGLVVKISGRVVTVMAPDSLTASSAKGTAWFYCISDSGKDKKLKLTGAGDYANGLAQVILPVGRYIARLRWTTGRGNFYSEEQFNVE